MYNASERYENYLNFYNFYPNSITFRILSSKALEKWKNVQSFQLNQLVNGKFYFSSDRREILLLKYDMWSRFLYEVENFCIEISDKTQNIEITSSEINYIISLCDKTKQTYSDIMQNRYNKSFDKKYVDIFLKTHAIIYDSTIKRIQSLNGLTIQVMFTEIVNIFCDMMQHTLIEIYELNNLFCKVLDECEFCEKTQNKTNKKLPFIIVSEINEKMSEECNNCILTERLKILKDYFNLNDIYIKNYTDKPISDELITKIESIGLKIDFRISLTS